MTTVTNTLEVIVRSKTYETPSIATFVLVSSNGGDLPAFTAGAHIDVKINEDLSRSYSLLNSPTEKGRYVISVLRDPKSRGGSVAMHDEIQEGSQITITEPKNHFPLCATSKKDILIAGGIGITPMLSMAEFLSSGNKEFELHYAGRSESLMAFLPKIRASAFSSRAAMHFDDVLETRFDATQVLQNPEENTHVYICGPTGFLEFVKESAKTLGWRDENVHFEYFGAAVTHQASDSSFTVKVQSTGTEYEIPSDKTVIAVLAEHGINIPMSCEQGVCGTCLVKVLEGTPDHRDHFLTNSERDSNTQFLPCVSRCKSACLVIDI